jgi:hypothetical protein
MINLKNKTSLAKKLKMQAFTKTISIFSSIFFTSICKCQIIFGNICNLFSFSFNYKGVPPLAQGNGKG